MKTPQYRRVYKSFSGRLFRVVVDPGRKETRLEPTTWKAELAREKLAKGA